MFYYDLVGKITSTQTVSFFLNFLSNFEFIRICIQISLSFYYCQLVCHDPFDEKTQSFISQWVEKNKILKNKNNGYSIRWVSLVADIEQTFGKKYTENKVKNFWYSKRRLKLEN